MARRKNYGPAHVAAVINPSYRASRDDFPERYGTLRPGKRIAKRGKYKRSSGNTYDQLGYKWYVVSVSSGKIIGAYEYNEDAKDLSREIREEAGYKTKVMSRSACVRTGCDPKLDRHWGNIEQNPSSSYLDRDAPRHVAAVLGNPSETMWLRKGARVRIRKDNWTGRGSRTGTARSVGRYRVTVDMDDGILMDFDIRALERVATRTNGAADDRALVGSMARWHKAEHRKRNAGGPAGGPVALAYQVGAMILSGKKKNPQRLPNHHLAVGTRVRLTSGRRAGLIAKQLPSDWYVVLIDGAGYETLRGRDLRRA